jgi:putative flippase GtrA
MNSSELFFQAVILGVITIIVGLLLSMALSFMKPELGPDCDKWNQYYVMEVSLFLTGFILRYIMENRLVKQYVN